MARLPHILAVLVLAGWPASYAETVLVEAGASMRFIANATDPGIGASWKEEHFDDSPWSDGVYGVGYEQGSGASALIPTQVPAGVHSVFTRTRFHVDDVSSVFNLWLGADYDDGYAAWINGVEVFRSSQLPALGLSWNTPAGLHESSNGPAPDYRPLVDISILGIPALHDGDNVLAVGVWNARLPSSDLVLVPSLSINRSPGLSRGPYLQMGTPGGIVVRWRTESPTDSRVSYGDDPGNMTNEIIDHASTTEHIVEIGDLSPDTRYFYAVGTTTQLLAGGDEASFFVTSPEKGTRKPTRVWVIGDSGTANASARAVRDAYLGFTGERHTDLWLMLGDNAYPDGTDSQYEAAVFDTYPDLLRSSVLWTTLGNHDGHSASSATQTGPYYDIFTLPTAGQAGGLPTGTEAYYSFDHANIHFICLDSHQTDRSPSGAMMSWLQQDALSTDQDWIVAFWHHPPYSKGSHDSDRESRLIQMRQSALPLLEDAGVDLVLAGHSHSYERSFLLDGHYGHSSTLTPDMIKSDGDGRPSGDGAYMKPVLEPIPHEGAVYVVAGSSGRISGGALNHPVMYFSRSVLGSLVLDFDGDRLDATFLDSTGTDLDRFTIMKGPAASQPVAAIDVDPNQECNATGGSEIELDGSGSSDADSTPGTNDDIVLYEWFEDLGSSSRKLGSGEHLDVFLTLGVHSITLRVTDKDGLTDAITREITVIDSTPPELSVDLEPSVLWPPDHRLVTVRAGTSSSDICGPVSISLITVTSSEPDDMPGGGDGRTVGDIGGADIASHDLEFSLRAERAARGSGRVYTVTYTATDEAGNPVSASASVRVPHSLGRRDRPSERP